VVSRCGPLTSPADAVAMAEVVRKLSYNAQIYETLGAAARQYAMAHLRSCLARRKATMSIVLFRKLNLRIFEDDQLRQGPGWHV